MPAAGVVALTAAIVLFVLAAPLRWATIALLGTSLLVPATLVMPNGLTSFLTVPRVVLVSFLATLLLRRHRGEIGGDAFRPTRVHVLFAAFVVVAFVNGLALAAPTTPAGTALARWGEIVDQLAFFIAVLTAVRAIRDDWWVAKAITALLAVFVGIAIGEHYTGGSWSRWFFEGVGSQLGKLNAAFPLERRGGELRVRSAAPFALAFAWVAAMLFPVLVAFSSRAIRRTTIFALALPGLVVAAILWSFTRSALATVVGAAVVLWMASRADRRIGALVGIGLAAAGIVLAAHPTFGRRFQTPETRGSVQARLQRLPQIFEIVAARPLRGVGLGGLGPFGFQTTDASYLLVYAELGVIGLVVFLALLGSVVLETLPGLRAPPGERRVLAAAAFTGLLVAIAGAAAYDLFSAQGSARQFWLLAAVGIAVGERAHPAPQHAPLVRVTRARLALAAAGIAGGAIVLAAAPAQAALSYRFQTIPAIGETASRTDLIYLGDVLGHSACDIARSIDAQRSGARLSCTATDRLLGPGAGRVRIRAPDLAPAQRASTALASVERHYLPAFTMEQAAPAASGRATAAWTAPVWLGLAALLGAVFLRHPSALER
jgi:hypothetical protein